MDVMNGRNIMLELRMLRLLNQCQKMEEVPTTWNVAHVILLYKKRDRNQRGHYRGVSWLNTAYKAYTRIVDSRLKKTADTLQLMEEQNGFRKGRSRVDNVIIIRQIIGKRREFSICFIGFIDYQIAFDRVNRTKLRGIVDRRGYPRHLIRVIQ